MTSTEQATGAERSLRVWGLAAAYGIGVLAALQSRINGELGHRLGDGVAAALISFGSGGVVLLLAGLALPRVRSGVRSVWRTVRTPVDADGRPALRWWQCIGGVAGAYLVTAQSATVSIIGVAVFTVSLVAGQAVSSLVVDRLGIGPGEPRPFTSSRVLGAVLALAAVVLAVSERFGDPSGLVLALLPALAGLGASIQLGMNGRVARTASADGYGAIAAAMINFTVGTVALTVVFLVDLLLRGTPRSLPAEPWLYAGGACGVAFITLAAAVVRVVGVFVLGLGTVAGQLIGSLILDLTLPAADHPVTGAVLAGTALALLAVVIARR